MKEVSKRDFDGVSVPDKMLVSGKSDAVLCEVTGVSNEELLELERMASNPSLLQKSLVAKLCVYVDFCFAKDLREKGFVTDYTRKFIELYNSILSVLHKELYGEKQVNVGTLLVTHSMIMNEVRKSSRVVDVEFVEKGDEE
jgi:hypothetical protein